MTPTPTPKALEAAASALHAFTLSKAHSNKIGRAAGVVYLAAAPSDELWIGEYMLQRGPTNGIWIGRRGGEGGQFATDDVERVIAEFYRENF